MKNLLYPRISIVTPSYNQAEYLEETILSVIGQHYPNLEYIIMDGGSTDGSQDIIKKYESHIAYWTSAKDGGQSIAINEGFAKATGSILGWLNSDDMYMSGSLSYAASVLDDKEPQLLSGNCFHFVSNSALCWGTDVVGQSEVCDLRLSDYISQPSTFWTKEAWLKTGILDESLTYAFDWEWFIRAKKKGVLFKPSNRYLSIYRIHEHHKTATGGTARLSELSAVYSRHAGQEYAELFYLCRQNKWKILLVHEWLDRFGFERFESLFLRLLLPKLFRRFRAKEVFNVLNAVD